MRNAYLCKESDIQIFVPLRSVGSKEGTWTGLIKGNIQDRGSFRAYPCDYYHPSTIKRIRMIINGTL